MSHFLELLFDLIFKPYTAMQEIVGRGLRKQGFFIFLLSVILPSLALWGGLESKIAEVSMALACLQLLVRLFMWLTGTAVMHLVAELLGGRGQAKDLLATLGFSQFPIILSLPLGILSVLVGDLGEFLQLVFSLGIVFWVLALHVIALRAVYDFSSLRALAVLFLPMVVFVAAIVLVAVVAVTQMVHFVPPALKGGLPL